jgi:hypothetical protein
MLESCTASCARGGRRQVVTVKSRYIMDNQTGGTIEVKQLGTPDLDDPAGGDAAHRCAQRLAPNERCAAPARAPAPLPPAAFLQAARQESRHQCASDGDSLCG